MGVAGLTDFLTSRFCECWRAPPSSADHVYLDLNSLLHEAVLAAILRSLGADKPMHPADDDEAVRILLSEAVHLIVRSDEGLDALWAMQVAPKLQMCYQHEKNAEVCDTYERIAAVILEAGRDAGGEGTGEGGDAEIEVEMRPGFAAIDER